MTIRANSAARRDIAYHLHPYTNAKKHEADGPLILSSGKGVFVYCAYAMFRQLPAGVPGAYRLFANLLALARVSGS